MPGPPLKFISSTRSDLQGRWSPDGKRIAFISGRSGIEEIWVCDTDGSNPVQVTSLRAPHVGWPNWSPDGRLLVFDSSAPGQRDIYVVSADGGAPERMTTDPGDDSMPSWSRDGRWIYFCSSRTGKPQVWKVPGGGGSAVQVTKDGGTSAFESVDRKLLYYAKERGRTSLWKIPVEGGEASRVLDSIIHTDFAIAGRGIYFKGSDLRSIHFFSFATGKTKLVASIDETFLGQGVSPDEKSILYTQYDQLGADLMLVENFR